VEAIGMARARALIGSIGASLIVAAGLPAKAETRGVIELFTSQGCSSCPAADKLLGELRNDPSLVTLTLSIDYWDYLGWKDTLAIPGHAILRGRKPIRRFAAIARFIPPRLWSTA
jgi:hypothetical protein